MSATASFGYAATAPACSSGYMSKYWRDERAVRAIEAGGDEERAVLVLLEQGDRLLRHFAVGVLLVRARRRVVGQRRAEPSLRRMVDDFLSSSLSMPRGLTTWSHDCGSSSPLVPIWPGCHSGRSCRRARRDSRCANSCGSVTTSGRIVRKSVVSSWTGRVGRRPVMNEARLGLHSGNWSRRDRSGRRASPGGRVRRLHDRLPVGAQVVVSRPT